MVAARTYRRSQRVRSQPKIGSCLSKILADSYGKMVYVGDDNAFFVYVNLARCKNSNRCEYTHSKIVRNLIFNSSLKCLKCHYYELQRAYLFARAFELIF